MLTSQQKIDAIYEKIARKDLEFWCWLDSGRNDWYLLDTSRYLVEKSEWKYKLYESYTKNKITDIIKIIGHPVMIWDVMDYLDNLPPEELLKIIEETEKIFYIWKYKRKPIEDQSDDCISFIFNLISYK